VAKSLLGSEGPAELDPLAQMIGDAPERGVGEPHDLRRRRQAPPGGEFCRTPFTVAQRAAQDGGGGLETPAFGHGSHARDLDEPDVAPVDNEGVTACLDEPRGRAVCECHGDRSLDVRPSEGGQCQRVAADGQVAQ
jgi:hypothetical protein